MAVKRFYETFHPEHYDLRINVNRKQKEINGTSTVTGEVIENPVFINQKNMTIDSVKVDGKDVPFDVLEKDEAIKIETGKNGKAIIEVEYSAPLTDTMMGIYPSYYEVDGVKKQIIGTQFETTFARQAFPCIDEPEAKATFTLALKWDEEDGEVALANMPEVEVDKDGYHHFEETVRMSSYLVAFAFGDLQSKTTHTKDGVLIGVYATKAHKPKELDFALDVAKNAIEFYEEFYQTKYPLPQSLQLALPDFSAGAMENWGLVTYREAYLLLDPDNTSLEMKKLVATVITHELAHQWFGDLVTMKWWDNLWLNESFANMMEYLSVDGLEPDWHIWEMFQTSEAPAALTRDATDGVQPIQMEINDPADIDSAFDSAIVYAKGSRMLVMVRSLLGDDALRKGLKYYFDHHKFGNATGDDLWDALSTATDLDIGKIMHSWLKQPGYPVVSAYVDSSDGHLKLSQQQFFVGEGKDVGRQWQIPLNANFKAPKIMSDKEIDLGYYKNLRSEAGHPLRINVGNNSHFIVKYDKTLLDDILAHVDELDPIAKLQLLQDLRLLAEGKQISYAAVVPLLTKFADSKSSVVINALYATAAKLRQFVEPESAQEKDLKKLYDKLSAGQVARLGWKVKPGESDEDAQIRPYELSASLYAENKDSIKTAHEIFTANEDNLEAMNADIRPYVLINEVKNFGNAELVDKLIKEYQRTADPSYKVDLRSAVTSTKDLAAIKAIVSDFENADVVKPQDLRGWYRGLLANHYGQQAAWDWIREDWDWLDKTVGGDMEFATFITVTTGVFHTPERLKEFKEFFEPKVNVPLLSREIKMDIKVIEGKVNLIEDEKDAVNSAVAKAID
ncbi:M1 family metallopeptidase [Lactobacillus crispatus]|jgi:membrane alanyl aminopeptidase|uniref:Aminopeptidase n=1 Tax=Lactobacillus crispatus TaxID=47770 RepID=A0AAW8WQ17_9LACO|nr:M1 family metallopeptidase [Lactobacillus crispatus]EEU19080.1 membrane alanyl aminopeptidase [Lactobacillus crispatus 125-2-CHN]EEX30021.1 membrane alanyl aminopeptidase [Lactobacillus crispatus MV-3A-US]EFD99456.1 membrane alanyl aminopeptidase [Lactobacillus crispatus 214-1]MBO4166265.1 M1 family metallopeptidase [Lactobacillus crispatus]MCT7686896.1 M1 family metallopeptidase [Lactobacillus crispatus]